MDHLEKYLSSSLVLFDPDTHTIDDWISLVKPSKFSAISTGADWIAVQNPNEEISEHAFCEEGYQNYFSSISNALKSSPQDAAKVKNDCVQKIHTLAKKQKYTTGYWSLYEELKDIDRVWHKLAIATHQGKLGCYSKLCLHKRKDNGFPIRIYVSDFTQKEKVKDVLLKLVDMGFKPRFSFDIKASFKPDLYTSLGISWRNKWHIKPTLYQEMYAEVIPVNIGAKQPIVKRSGKKDLSNVNVNNAKRLSDTADDKQGCKFITESRTLGSSDRIYQNQSKKYEKNGFRQGSYKKSETNKKTIETLPNTIKQGTTVIFCYNITLNTTQTDIYNLFTKYGQVSEVDLKSKFAFVHMADPFEAFQAIMALNGTCLDGNIIQVSVKTQK